MKEFFSEGKCVHKRVKSNNKHDQILNLEREAIQPLREYPILQYHWYSGTVSSKKNIPKLKKNGVFVVIISISKISIPRPMMIF